MPKFNVQLNHIDRSKQHLSEQTEQINPFQVNLRTTGANLAQEEPREIDQVVNGHSLPQTGKFSIKIACQGSSMHLDIGIMQSPTRI